MKFSILLAINVSICLGNNQDTTSKSTLNDSLQNNSKTLTVKLVTKNPVTSAAISALIPGGGQIYTGNYVKSGMFFSLEAIIGLVAYSRYVQGADFKKNSEIMLDSLIHFPHTIRAIRTDTVKNASNKTDSVFFDTLFSSTQYGMFYDYNRFLEKDNRYFIYQSLAWMGGLYYWNILDALKNTKYFMNDNHKLPSTAGWLAAIPGLGLGQLYNGELSKAGMIFTVQMNMAYMVFNYNKLMHICEDNLKKIDDPRTKESWAPAAAQLKGGWDSKRNDAFRNRNMWAWYSVAFYFYGIFDAIVDAHLHDATKKMKLEPDLLPGKGIGLNCTLPF
jgi:hypothetical protein